MRWTPVPLIDGGLGLSRRERRAVIDAAWKRWMKHPWNAGLHGALSIGALVGVGVVQALAEMMHNEDGWYHTVFWLVVKAGVLVAVFLTLRRRGYGPYVYEELRARGHDVCGKCGYLIEGLDGVCPECGEARS